MATHAEKQSPNYASEFLAQYTKNPEGGFDGPAEDLAAIQRIGTCLKEVERGEAQMFQESATMRFVG